TSTATTAETAAAATATAAAAATPTPVPAKKKTSVRDGIKLRRQGKRKVTMVTVYDYPSAVHVCRAGIDILRVGASVGMVELGYDTTQPVTVDAMLPHCK
ncbi:unnamed protein product, partial [Scytosiphon promiscuus]